MNGFIMYACVCVCVCVCVSVIAQSLCLSSRLFSPIASIPLRLLFIHVYLSLAVLLTLFAAVVLVATMSAPRFKVCEAVSDPSTVVALPAFPMLTGPSPTVVVPVVVA
jgi:hypothetical protein